MWDPVKYQIFDITTRTHRKQAVKQAKRLKSRQEQSSMIGLKRPVRPNEDLPSCVTGEAPSHFNPSKKQATGEEKYKIASNIETDAHRLETRLKQCQYGKNTIGYDNYTAAVPKNKRSNNINEHPRTPDPFEIQSKRAFEGRIKVWRRALHSWDLKGEANSASTESAFDAAVAEGRKKAASTRDRKSEKEATADTRRNSRNSTNSSNVRNDVAREKENGLRRRTSEDRANDLVKMELDDNHDGDRQNTDAINNEGNRNISDVHPIDGEKTAILKEALLDSESFKCGASSSSKGSDAIAQLECKDEGEGEEIVQEDTEEESYFIDRDRSPDASKNILMRDDSNGCGHFDSMEGREIIVNEDSMQSLDYEKCMLEQHFNSDTVDVLDPLDEEDDEDVL